MEEKKNIDAFFTKTKTYLMKMDYSIFTETNTTLIAEKKDATISEEITLAPFFGKSYALQKKWTNMNGETITNFYLLGTDTTNDTLLEFLNWQP